MLKRSHLSIFLAVLATVFLSVHLSLSKKTNSIIFATHYGQDYIFKELNLSPNVERLPPVPLWITDYIHWHNEIRKQYPDNSLFDDPNAPPLLIKYCGIKCGGTYDRLANIGDVLYLAHVTKRLLLIKWYHPTDLENFLETKTLNWTLPLHKDVQTLGSLKENGVEFASICNKKNRKYGKGINLLLNNTKFAKKRIILIGGNGSYGKWCNIKSLDEAFYGHVWRVLFKPSNALENELAEFFYSNNLLPGKYNAIHCRVRHDARFRGKFAPGKIQGKSADEAGLVFSGHYKMMAVNVAVHALECAVKHWNASHPIYFFSDSDNLVELIVSKGYTALQKSYSDDKLREIKAHVPLIGRINSSIPAHIDLQNATLEAYRSTFVDLYIAIYAKCISYGVGNFAHLASMISGTQCLMIHEQFRTAKKRYNQQQGKQALKCYE